jgi:hypothetical protein
MSFKTRASRRNISTPSSTSSPNNNDDDISTITNNEGGQEKKPRRQYKMGSAVSIVESIPAVAAAKKKNVVDEIVRESTGCYCLVVTSALKSNRSTYILITSKPYRSVAMHNRRLVRNRDTPNAAPYLFCRYSAGPFYIHETIVDFVHQVVHGGRGPDSKVFLVEELAAQYGVDCRDALLELTGEELRQQFRRDGAPQSYFDELQRVEASCAIIEKYMKAQEKKGQE